MTPRDRDRQELAREHERTESQNRAEPSRCQPWVCMRTTTQTTAVSAVAAVRTAKRCETRREGTGRTIDADQAEIGISKDRA